MAVALESRSVDWLCRSGRPEIENAPRPPPRCERFNPLQRVHGAAPRERQAQPIDGVSRFSKYTEFENTVVLERRQKMRGFG